MTDQKDYLLVVDDIPDILTLLDATLSFKGYRVVTALNGQEALEQIQRERPALIIADILMPKMDGFSLVHRLRINPETRDIPVVFLSATYVTPEDKEFALTIGVTRFIEKPVDLEQFVPVIAELLARRPASHQTLNEFDFYEGYRQRLETKLRQKNTQIARDTHLLETLSGEEKKTIEVALQQAEREREDLQNLLDQIHDQLETLKKQD